MNTKKEPDSGRRTSGLYLVSNAAHGPRTETNAGSRKNYSLISNADEDTFHVDAFGINVPGEYNDISIWIKELAMSPKEIHRILEEVSLMEEAYEDWRIAR